MSQKLGAKDDDIRNQIIEEIQAEAFSERPDSAGDYQLPEIINEEEAVDNELLRWWSEHSFNNGFSQEEFEEGIKIYADSVLGSGPVYEEEVAKLGDNAEARIEAASFQSLRSSSPQPHSNTASAGSCACALTRSRKKSHAACVRTCSESCVCGGQRSGLIGALGLLWLSL